MKASISILAMLVFLTVIVVGTWFALYLAVQIIWLLWPSSEFVLLNVTVFAALLVAAGFLFLKGWNLALGKLLMVLRDR